MARAPRWLVVLAATAGCRGLLGIEEPTVGDAGSADAPASPDASCTLQAARFDPCALGSPGPALHLVSGNTYTFDTTPTPATLTGLLGGMVTTTNLTMVQTDQKTAVILFVDALTIDTSAHLRVIGARPAIIVTVGDLVVGGDIDAGSHLTETDAAAHISVTTQLGAGANQTCGVLAPQAGGDGLPSAGSGGGGGGALQGNGGKGGDGDLGNAAGGAAGARILTPSTVRGGCSGATSGAAGTGASAPASQATRSSGGAGGGAIHLASRSAVRISGSVLASGAGGAGSPQGAACGGGGGGSGGYIGIEAPVVQITGYLAANGGGGGGGAQNANHGNNGSDGRQGTDAAPGGFAQTCGTAGAAGGSIAKVGGTVTVTDSCGGGGGGGGAGYVMIWSPGFTSTGSTISPMPISDLP